MSVFNFLEMAAHRDGNEPAVYYGTVRHATYAELLDRSLRIGAALRTRGEPGDRVLIATPNCPEYPEIMFGIWAAGMVAVPLNAKLHGREMLEIARDSGAKTLFLSTKTGGMLDGHEGDRIVIGEQGYQELMSSTPAPAAEATPDDLAWLFYTSGTTGRSKGAMLTHRNLGAMAVTHLADLEPVERGDGLIHAAPLSHGSGLYMLPYTLRSACHIIPASGGFDPREFLDLSAHHPRCGAFLAPTMVHRLRIEAEKEMPRTLAIRSIIYGGGPMYLDEIKRALKAFGPVFSQLYGQGESPMTITGLTRADHIDADDTLLSSVGWPRSGVEVRVVGEDGQSVPPGEVGMIICRGDTVMRGYWNDPAATATTLRNGWLHTGDMGSFDTRGCLTLRDRAKDVIITGGTNVYPREVEDVLLTHPDVAEACVVGEPDPEWGENVVAFIVPEPDMTVDANVLEKHCLDHIARFKRPKRYIFLKTLPKSSYGKVLKRELVALLHSVSG